MRNDPFFAEISDDEPQERISLVTYRVTFELSIADTDAPPSDWIPNAIEQLLEDGESFNFFECSEV